MSLEVVHLGHNFALGSIGRVLIQSWKGKIQDMDQQRCFDHAQVLAKRHRPNKIVSVALITARAGFPDEASRKRSAQLITEMGTLSLGAATIIDGTGFVASAARAILAGILMMGRSEFPQHVFSDNAAACGWLVPLLGDGHASEAEVVAAIEDLRWRQMAAP